MTSKKSIKERKNYRSLEILTYNNKNMREVIISLLLTNLPTKNLLITVS